MLRRIILSESLLHTSVNPGSVPTTCYGDCIFAVGNEAALGGFLQLLDCAGGACITAAADKDMLGGCLNSRDQ